MAVKMAERKINGSNDHRIFFRIFLSAIFLSSKRSAANGPNRTETDCQSVLRTNAEVVLPAGSYCTVATCTATPLLTLLVVTMAVSEPEPAAGFLPLANVTVSCVLLFTVTVPATATPLKATVFVPAGSKPTPVMTTWFVVVVFRGLARFWFTTGEIVATWTAVPLLCPKEVTEAISLPAVGAVENEKVTDFALVAETALAAPPLNEAEFVPTVSKPKPWIVTPAFVTPLPLEHERLGRRSEIAEPRPRFCNKNPGENLDHVSRTQRTSGSSGIDVELT